MEKIDIVSPEVRTMLCDLINQIEHEYSEEYRHELAENEKLSELWRKSKVENRKLRYILEIIKEKIEGYNMGKYDYTIPQIGIIELLEIIEQSEKVDGEEYKLQFLPIISNDDLKNIIEKNL